MQAPLRDICDYVARHAALITTALWTFTFVASFFVAPGDSVVFESNGGRLSIGSHGWLLSAFPITGLCFYAIAIACAARTPFSVHQFSLLAGLMTAGFSIVIVGGALLYEMRASPPPLLIELVSLGLLLAILGLFAFFWAAVAALNHAEHPGPPPRLSDIVPTFLLTIFLLPISAWFIQARVNTVLKMPRLGEKQAP